MKMFNITKAKGVKSEYFHTQIWLISFLNGIALKYETPMFQKFRTHSNSITVLFPILAFCICFIFKILLIINIIDI